MAGPSKRETTHTRLVSCALELFETHGFEATTAAEIAAAAGVTEMTFFRHFASKDLTVTADPFDPLIASEVEARPHDEPAVLRAARGVRIAFDALPEAETGLLRRRVRVIAASPVLRAAVLKNTEATETAIRDRLRSGGAAELPARVAAAAVVSALTAALYDWADNGRAELAATIRAALTVLEGRDD